MSQLNQSIGESAEPGCSPVGYTVSPAVSPACAAERALGALAPVALPMRDGCITIAALIDLYMAHYEGRDPTRARRLQWWVPKVGALPLQELTDDHVHMALEQLAQQPPRYFAGKDADGQEIFKLRTRARTLSPATVNKHHLALQAVLSWAIKRRIAPRGYDNPCRAVPRRTENEGRVRYLSEEEQARLLEACRASRWRPLYALVLLALTTGARRGELMGARWADVDLSQATLHVARSKNGEAKALPLTQPVVEALRAFRGSPGALVFGSKRASGKAFHAEPYWQEALRTAKVKNFRFHDLRHSCASHLAQAGAPLLAIADLLGHKTLVMTKRYAHLSTDSRRDLVLKHLGSYA